MPQTMTLKSRNQEVNILFSIQFMKRCADYLGISSMSEIQKKLSGNVEYNESDDLYSVSDGLLDNLELRSLVIASGQEAYEKANKILSDKSFNERIEDADNFINDMDNPLNDPIWFKVFIELANFFNPQDLPSTDAEGQVSKKPIKKSKKA